MNILKAILKQKQKELVELKKNIDKRSLILKCRRPRKILNFRSRISKPGKLNIIGEVKRSSPSAGLLKKDFEPLKIAYIYKKNGVSALSVLTDEKFFGGRLEYIKVIKKEINLPILRKDFIIDEYQIYESYLAGADAVLLIVRLLPEKKLKKFIAKAKKLRMSAVVEVHDRKDVKKALRCHAQIIGINNRNLKTFKVDLCRTEKLFGFIPKKKVIISESGIKKRADLLYFKSIGVNAALIGETFMKASNLNDKVKKLLKGIN
jgi:indole-3-glycerol phosphate synthase